MRLLDGVSTQELREAKQHVFILATEKEATQERLSEADQLESEVCLCQSC